MRDAVWFRRNVVMEVAGITQRHALENYRRAAGWRGGLEVFDEGLGRKTTVYTAVEVAQLALLRRLIDNGTPWVFAGAIVQHPDVVARIRQLAHRDDDALAEPRELPPPGEQHLITAWRENGKYAVRVAKLIDAAKIILIKGVTVVLALDAVALDAIDQLYRGIAIGRWAGNEEMAADKPRLVMSKGM